MPTLLAKKFVTEEQMVTMTSLNTESITRRKAKTFVMHELEIGSGILDIAIIVLDEQRLAQRLQWAPDPVTTGLELVMLSQLETIRRLSVIELSQRTNLRGPQVSKVIAALCEKGLAFESGKGFSAHTYAKPLYTRFVSVEAKLNQWRKALEQAFRNGLFATQTFVVIDKAHSTPAIRHLEEFARSRVGLIVAENLNGTCKVVAPAVQQKPISAYFCQIANEKLIEKLSLQQFTIAGG
jgi:hypothetical protein